MNITTQLTAEELKEWYELRQQIVNGYHMSSHDYSTLIRLNHLVMGASHEIHNDNMLSDRKGFQPLAVTKEPEHE